MRLAIGPSPRRIELPERCAGGRTRQRAARGERRGAALVRAGDAPRGAPRRRAPGRERRAVGPRRGDAVAQPLRRGLARRRGRPLRARLRARGPRAGGRSRRRAARRASRPRRHGLRRRGLARVRDARRGAPLPRPGRRVARRRGSPRASASPLDERQARLDRPPRSALDPRLRRHGDRRAGSTTRLDGELAVVFLVSREAAAEWVEPRCRTSRCCTARSSRLPLGRADRALGADRRLARPPARLPPARDPPEPPARLPCRADAAGAPELDARHRPRRPAPALAGARARDGALVLQPAAARPAPAARDDAARLLRPRALERAARERRAVPRRGPSPAAARGRARRELGPHGRQGRHLAALRPLPRPEPGHGGRPAPLPRHRAGAGAGHRAGRRPTSSTAGGRGPSTTSSCAATGSTRRRPLVLVAGNTPSNAPYEGRFVERLVAWWEQAPRRAPSAPLPAAPARPCSGGSGSPQRLGATESSCRRRATPTSTTSRRCSSTSTSSSATRARSSSTRSSATVRPSACSTTRGRRPASRGRRRTSSASTTRSSRRPARSYRAESFDEVVAGIERALERPGRARGGAAARRRSRSSATVDGQRGRARRGRDSRGRGA